MSESMEKTFRGLNRLGLAEGRSAMVKTPRVWLASAEL